MLVQFETLAEAERAATAAPRLHVRTSAGRIASLDGLRAVSILMVVLGHAFTTISPTLRAAWVPPLVAIFGNGNTGVAIFFVISGFLITTLLLKEREKTGSISILNFYIRRGFRIWPAFFVYVGTVAALAAMGRLVVSGRELAAASLFVWNYVPGTDAWELAHTWSLSVEEQFYLVWPLCVMLLNRRQIAVFATAVILLLPFVRVATYVLVPTLAWQIQIRSMTHTRADALMWGALLAIWWSSPKFNELLSRLFKAHAQTIAAIYLFLIRPQFDRNSFTLPIGYTLDGAAIFLLIAYATRRADSALGRLLNTPLMVHIGLIWYSLYLWQQLFSNAHGGAFHIAFPLNILCAFVAAELSYFVVEQTFLRLRQRLAPNS